MRDARLLAACVLLMSGLVPAAANASQNDSGVDLHGYVSQGYLKTNRNNYLGQSQRGSFDFNEAALNAGRDLGGGLRVGLQLSARDLGALGNDRIILDWAYGDYRLRDWFGLRVGRIREPGGFYNESRDIDLARTAVLLPQSVYPENYRDVLSAYNGVCGYGTIHLGSLGSADYQAYVGGNNIDSGSSVEQAFNDTGALSIDHITLKYAAGASLIWETPLSGLRLGGTWGHLVFDADGQTTAIPPVVPSQPVDFKGNRFDLAVASVKYTHGDLVLSAEAMRIAGRVQSATAGIPSSRVSQGGWYLNAEYRLSSSLEVGTYYSQFYADAPRHGDGDPALYQHDWAATVRYDISDSWLVKLEGHWIRGTAQLLRQENPGPAGPSAPFGTKSVQSDWLLLALKTTVSF